MARFNPSYTGLGELLASEGMRGHMHATAKKIAEQAAATSPVGPLTDGERERYVDSWRVESGIRDVPSRRAVGRVINDSDHAAAVEFGNGRTSPKTIEAHFVLTRAIDAASRE